MMGGWGGMFGFGMVFWIVLLVVIAWVIVRAGQGQVPQRSRPSEDARAILDARLARGEVSVEEYKKLRETLG